MFLFLFLFLFLFWLRSCSCSFACARGSGSVRVNMLAPLPVLSCPLLSTLLSWLRASVLLGSSATPLELFCSYTLLVRIALPLSSILCHTSFYGSARAPTVPLTCLHLCLCANWCECAVAPSRGPFAAPVEGSPARRRSAPLRPSLSHESPSFSSRFSLSLCTPVFHARLSSLYLQRVISSLSFSVRVRCHHF